MAQMFQEDNFNPAATASNNSSTGGSTSIGAGATQKDAQAAIAQSAANKKAEDAAKQRSLGTAADPALAAAQAGGNYQGLAPGMQTGAPSPDPTKYTNPTPSPTGGGTPEQAWANAAAVAGGGSDEARLLGMASKLANNDGSINTSNINQYGGSKESLVNNIIAAAQNPSSPLHAAANNAVTTVAGKLTGTPPGGTSGGTTVGRDGKPVYQPSSGGSAAGGANSSIGADGYPRPQPSGASAASGSSLSSIVNRATGGNSNGPIEVTYQDSKGNTYTGYNINGKTYTDPQGKNEIPNGSYVKTADGKLYHKEAAGSQLVWSPDEKDYVEYDNNAAVNGSGDFSVPGAKNSSGNVTYDPRTGQYTIYWVNDKTGTHSNIGYFDSAGNYHPNAGHYYESDQGLIDSAKNFLTGKGVSFNGSGINTIDKSQYGIYDSADAFLKDRFNHNNMMEEYWNALQGGGDGADVLAKYGYAYDANNVAHYVGGGTGGAAAGGSAGGAAAGAPGVGNPQAGASQAPEWIGFGYGGGTSGSGGIPTTNNIGPGQNVDENGKPLPTGGQYLDTDYDWIKSPDAAAPVGEYGVSDQWRSAFEELMNPQNGAEKAITPNTQGERAPEAPDLKPYLEQWRSSAEDQARNQIDYATNQGVNDLTRAEEDAQQGFRTAQEQISAEEAVNKDNQALYAEARGDKGGIGAAQYDSIANTAAINRQSVKDAQTKLSTDTARQIADLRAQGDYKKADALLQISQEYLSNLMSLEQWAANYGLSAAQFNESVREWDENFRLAAAELTGNIDGQETLAARNARQNFGLGLMNYDLNRVNSERDYDLGLRNYDLNRTNSDRDYQVNRMNYDLNRTNADRNYDLNRTNSDRDYQMQQLNYQRNLRNDDRGWQADVASLTGYFNGSPTMARENGDRNFRLSEANVTGEYNGKPTYAAQKGADSNLATMGNSLLSAGIMPSREQLNAMGLSPDQAQAILMAQQAANTPKTYYGGGGGGTTSGGGNTGNTPSAWNGAFSNMGKALITDLSSEMSENNTNMTPSQKLDYIADYVRSGAISDEEATAIAQRLGLI